MSLPFQTAGYEHMELSTQLLIAEALKRGYQVEILDAEDQFIRIRKGNHEELIRKANQTSLDHYITHFVMDNKKVLKKILQEKGLPVPQGASFSQLEEASQAFENWKGKKTVIKPRSTNFGVAVSILEKDFTEEHFLSALKLAFQEDEVVLVEEFAEGKEYRFLVIDDKCIAVLHRIPANVVGDGKSTIEELVKEKNAHPFRGTGYKTPLEKIQLGEFEEAFLQRQGLNKKNVLESGQQVFLRANSNISTGGDSLDQSDEMHPSYKQVALEAVKAAGAVIAGVDMIIQNLSDSANQGNHVILELNWNPVLYFHDFPYEGQNRQSAAAVLDVLFENPAKIRT